MQNLKASLPPQVTSENLTAGDSRQMYNDPGLVVYNSGQTIPVNNYYNQNAAAGNPPQLPYIPANMLSAYYGAPGMAAGAMQGYGWSYPVAPAVANVDPAPRLSWSSEDNHSPPQTATQDYYTPLSYVPITASQSQHYIVGPIQPMKCADNKSYEMVNLDELVSREPPIPRAVPALWTNQEEISLAKCL